MEIKTFGKSEKYVKTSPKYPRAKRLEGRTVCKAEVS